MSVRGCRLGLAPGGQCSSADRSVAVGRSTVVRGCMPSAQFRPTAVERESRILLHRPGGAERLGVGSVPLSRRRLVRGLRRRSAGIFRLASSSTSTMLRQCRFALFAVRLALLPHFRLVLNNCVFRRAIRLGRSPPCCRTDQARSRRRPGRHKAAPLPGWRSGCVGRFRGGPADSPGRRVLERCCVRSVCADWRRLREGLGDAVGDQAHLPVAGAERAQGVGHRLRRYVFRW